MKTFLILILTLALPAFAAESGGGHHGDDHGIPTMVYYQAVNILAFIAILVYFGRAKVKALFLGRHEEYTRLARETEKARQDLEHKKTDLIRRLDVLKRTSDQSVADAKVDAEKYYRSELEKTIQAAALLDKEVETQIRDDRAKVIEQLRAEALQMSTAAAENELMNVSGAEKTKVTKQFTQRVEGAIV